MKLVTAAGSLWLGVFSLGLVGCGDRADTPAPTQPPTAQSPGTQPPAPPVAREISVNDAPTAVSAALSRARPGLKILRVTAHERGNGLLVYEFTGTDAGQDSRVEVKYDGKLAEVLVPESTP